MTELLKGRHRSVLTAMCIKCLNCMMELRMKAAKMVSHGYFEEAVLRVHLDSMY